MTSIGIDGGSEGKALFLAAQASSGVEICNHEMMGKSVELTSADGTKTYIGIGMLVVVSMSIVGQ